MLEKAVVPALLKAAGHIGGYFINRMETARANYYNDPKQQVARLREAGLPYQAEADFKNEHVGVPDTSGFGAGGEGLASYLDNQKTVKEIDILEQQIGYWGSKAGLEANALAISDEEIKFLVDEGYIRDGQAISWARSAKEIEYKMKELSQGILTFEREIKATEQRIANATEKNKVQIIAEQLDKLYNENEQIRQSIGNVNDFNIAKHKVIDVMTEGGLGFFEALTLMVLQGFTSNVSVGGLKAGN